MATLRIEHADGSTTTISADRYSDEKPIDEQWRAKVDIPRSEWLNALPDIDDIDDEFYVDQGAETLFGGRLADGSRGDPVTVTIASFEQDLIDAESIDPSSSDATWDNAAHDTIVTNATNAVSTVSAGTVETVKSGLGFFFDNVSRAKQVRETARAAGAEVRYNADKTLDSVADLGTDRSETIGPARQNIGEQVRIIEQQRDNHTHLKVLGTGEGEHQLSTTRTLNRYSGGRKKWKEVENKDLSKSSELEAFADEVETELNNAPEHIEIEASLFGLSSTPQVGDTYPVVYSDENIDQRLEAIRVRRIIDGDGERFEVLLSSRRLARNQETKQVRAAARRTGHVFEGNAVPVTGSFGPEPFNSANNAEFEIDYPTDVVKELKAELKVVGLPYWTYSSGALQDSTDTSNNDSYSWSGVSWNDDELKSKDLSLASDWSNYPIVFFFRVDDGASSPQVLLGDQFQVKFTTSGITQVGEGHERIYTMTNKAESEGSLNLGHAIQAYDTLPYLFVDSTTTVHVRNKTGKDLDSVDVDIAFFNIRHTHAPSPGISTFNTYPENLDVLVNGNSLGKSLGDGSSRFEERVDISGELSSGFNKIEFTTDTRCRVYAAYGLDLYRQIRGN